ncbi:hypothetical protein M0R72_17105 [Candidatus Pacearchaeota archaeon]|jgi:hypothetical protein|nr:hypothetical protein [Candidatus Pacearchaeota archaeon]
MRFYNKTKSILQVKDSGGAVMLGPFLPGTAGEGPWYGIHEISDSLLELWLSRGKIGMVE